MEAQIDQAISSSDYASLSSIFTTGTAYQSLGQGEQRTLSAYFVKAVQESPTFLPDAFHSPEIRSIMKQTLNHLPPTVENALDNKLRYRLFTFLIDELEDYRNAAIVLSGIRMEESSGHGENDDDECDRSKVYYISNADRTDVYVKIAECFLNEEDYVEAETFVNKAGMSVESIGRPEEHVTLILRFKSVYARVLDANRKFLQAAGRYYDLSQVGDNTSMMDIIDNDDLLEFLGRAATCAILAPSSAQRQRVLGQVYKDQRLHQLDSISHFKTHSNIVTKMFKNQIILHNDDWITFENSLSDHQKAIMSDGLTIVQRALIEHNMVAVSRLYTSIYFTDLGQLLGVSSERAEKIACTMIMSGNLLNGTIDEVDGVLNFKDNDMELVNWDGAIMSFCSQLNSVADIVRQHA